MSNRVNIGYRRDANGFADRSYSTNNRYVFASGNPQTARATPNVAGINWNGSHQNLLDAHNDATGMTSWMDFDRWYSPDLHQEEPSGRHYIFFCRPDLHLVDAAGASYKLSNDSRAANDPFFQYLSDFHPEIISSLCAEFGNGTGSMKKTTKQAVAGSGFGNSSVEDGTSDINGTTLTIHSLIPYLTGRVESIQLPDYTIKDSTLIQPYTKYTVPYSSSAIESQTGGSFDVVFRDDKNFAVRKLFYAWIYYMDGVMRYKFIPKPKYIRYNALDYATSIYDIQVDATGEKIIWWSKYTGAFPTNVPFSDLSFNKGSDPNRTVTIPFSYFHYEALNPTILVELNYNSLGYIYMRGLSVNQQLNPPVKTAAIYDGDQSSVFLGSNRVGRPVVFYGKGEKVAKLKWLLPID